jgi:hypothetical protein
MDGQLMTLKQYRAVRFARGSEPSMATLKRWVNAGTLPAKMIGGRWYVEVNREAANSGNALVDKVLNGD